MKRNVLNVFVVFFVLLISCEKVGDEKEEFQKNRYVEMAYDDSSFFPDGFFQDAAAPGHNVYYVNTVSISPINQRDSRWIELSTNDRDEALMWVNLTIDNSNDRLRYSLVGERETEKYFEFKSVVEYIANPSFSYVVLFRVHKASYYESVFDRFAPWHFIYETEFGFYNGKIEKAKVQECIEYLWVQNTFTVGHRVISSQIREAEGYFEVHISSLALTGGSWGLRDIIRVYDNYIRFNKGSRLITFQQLLREKHLGIQR